MHHIVYQRTIILVMKSTSTLVFILFAVQYPVSVAAQALQTITPKAVSLKVATTEPFVINNYSTSHNISCYHSYTTRDRRIPEPLYVIDGKLVGSENLSHISPNDIEVVEVVKGIKAISLYGQQGNNGVMVIRTKRHRSK